MTSDMYIPRTSAIIARLTELHASAVRLSDDATADQLKRLSDALLAGARLAWELGALLVASPSGGRYRVTRGGCDCPNGRKCAKRQCWHVAAFELLLDMLGTEAESADNAADEAAHTWEVFSERLDATARALEGMRASQGRAMGQRLCAARGALLAFRYY